MSAALLFKPWLAPLMRQRSMCRALLAAAVVLGGGVLMGWSLWPCVFADVTGLPCPGCGLTRAASALLRGDWRAAMLLHPFSPFFAPVGLAVLLGAVLPPPWVALCAGRVELLERKTRLTAVFLAALVCFSLLRMLGFWYQPPLSGRSGLIFMRSSGAGQSIPAQQPTTTP